MTSAYGHLFPNPHGFDLTKEPSTADKKRSVPLIYVLYACLFGGGGPHVTITHDAIIRMVMIGSIIEIRSEQCVTDDTLAWSNVHRSVRACSRGLKGQAKAEKIKEHAKIKEKRQASKKIFPTTFVRCYLALMRLLCKTRKHSSRMSTDRGKGLHSGGYRLDTLPNCILKTPDTPSPKKGPGTRDTLPPTVNRHTPVKT